MGASVDILFKVGGISDVKSAISSVGASLDKLARQAVGSTQKAANDQVAGYRKVASEAERAAKAATQATERGQRERAATVAKERKEYERWWADQVKANERAEREKTKVVEREESARARAAERWGRQRERIVQTSMRMEQVARERQMREEESRARVIGSRAGGAFGRVMGYAGRVAGVVGMLGGGFAVADAVRAGMSEESAAGSAMRGAATNKGGITKKDLIDRSRAAAVSTGLVSRDISTGIDEFLKKAGDMDAAVEMLQTLADVSAATGTKIEDLGKTAGDVFNKVGDVSKTKDVLLAFAGFGKAGALDVRDLGEYGARLTAGAGAYDGDKVRNIKTMGVFAQMALKSGLASGAAEATMAAESVSLDIKENREKFKKHGIDIWSDKSETTLRDPEEIIVESLKKTKGGKAGAMLDLFGRRSAKLMEGFGNIYRERGETGVRSEIANIRASEMTPEQVRAGIKDKLSETETKLNIATEKFHAAMADKLLPKMPELIGAIEKLIPAFTSLVDTLVNYPLPALIGGAIVAAIGKASIASLIEKSFATAAQLKVGGATPVGEAGNLAGGKGGAVGLGLAAAAAGFTVGTLIVEKMVTPALEGSASGKQYIEGQAGNVESITSALRAGRISPEQAKAQAERIRSEVQGKARPISAGDAVENILLQGPAAAIRKGREADAMAENVGKVIEALNKLATEIDNKQSQIAGADLTGNGGDGYAGTGAPGRAPVGTTGESGS